LRALLLDGFEGPTSALYDNQQQQLVMKYLLELTAFLDATDAAGFEQLRVACEKMIMDVYFPEDLVQALLEAWARCSCSCTVNTNTNTLELLDSSFKLASSVKAQELPEGLSEELVEEFDLLRQIRCMEILVWTLTTAVKTQRGAISSIQQSDHFDFISSTVSCSLQQPDSELRCLAVRGLGLLGLSSETLCTRNYPLLFQVASNEVEENDIRCQAVQILSDFAMIYPDKFRNDAAFGNVLCRLQSSSSDSVTTRVALETSAKLFYSRLAADAKLFSNLLKFFFLPDVFAVYFPADEESQSQLTDAFLGSSVRLQQILSVFFQTFFSINRENARLIVQSIAELVPDLTQIIQSGDVTSVVLDKVTSTTYCYNYY
jgi:hypothetical protein